MGGACRRRFWPLCHLYISLQLGVPSCAMELGHAFPLVLPPQAAVGRRGGQAHTHSLPCPEDCRLRYLRLYPSRAGSDVLPRASLTAIQSLCQVFSSRRFHHISELTPLTPSPTLVRKGRKETCGEGDLGNGLFCFLGVPMPFCLLLSAHILLHSPGNRCLSNPGFQPRRKPTNTLRHYKSVS